MLMISPELEAQINYYANQSGCNAEQFLQTLLIDYKPKQHRYDLHQLLAQCEGVEELTQEDRDWDTIQPVGRELI